MKLTGAYIKAIFLMMVFSMNTVVGTACSFSKVFHQSHHHGPSTSGKHEHAGEENHSHDHNGSHHNSEKKGSDECCSKSSVEFNKLDKSISQSLELQVVDLSDFAITYLHYNLSLLSRNEERELLSHVRWRFPATIQDLRIVIQSFQI